MLKMTRACNREHRVKIPLSQKLTCDRLTEGDLCSPRGFCGVDEDDFQGLYVLAELVGQLVVLR